MQAEADGFEKFEGKSRSVGGMRIIFYESGIGCVSAALVSAFPENADAIELFFNESTKEIGIKPTISTMSGDARKLMSQAKSNVRTFSGKGFLDRYSIPYPNEATLHQNGEMFIGKLENFTTNGEPAGSAP